MHFFWNNLEYYLSFSHNLWPDIIVKASETAYYVYDEKMQTKAQFSLCVIINNIITFQEIINIFRFFWATFITFETGD